MPSVDEDPAGTPPDEGEIYLPATEGPESVYRGLHDKLIPIYCSFLAAVQGISSRPGVGPRALGCTVAVPTAPIAPPNREELEVLESLILGGGPNLELLDGGPGLGEGEWSRLAGLLGYTQEQIDGLRLCPQPLRALLGDWAGREGAGRDRLCSALSEMDREDLSHKLLLQPTKAGGAKSNATSVASAVDLGFGPRALGCTVAVPTAPIALPNREELEVLESLILGGGPDLELLDGGPGLGEGEWSRLAGLLGYTQEQIDGLRLCPQPLRALLGDWAGREGAGRDRLCSALSKMDREDLSHKLLLQPTKAGGAKSNATSVNDMT
ncbi:hypothetical protein CRUP_009273 [Coryphaenoides rupestris]|nr:hypothetical protein CRUP_009273 [Coryphaenoides rupestris]